MWRYGSVPLVALVVWIITDAISRGVPSVDVIVAVTAVVVSIAIVWREIEDCDE
jgi:hypothetical protein